MSIENQPVCVCDLCRTRAPMRVSHSSLLADSPLPPINWTTIIMAVGDGKPVTEHWCPVCSQLIADLRLKIRGDKPA